MWFEINVKAIRDLEDGPTGKKKLRAGPGRVISDVSYAAASG